MRRPNISFRYPVRTLLPLTVALATMLVAGTGCGVQAPRTQGLKPVGEVSAMVPLPDGGLRYAERSTGSIYDMQPGGGGAVAPVAHVDVSNAGSRGILGLAVDQQRRTFAAWTDPTGVLTVGQVLPGPTRIIWRGPHAPDTRIGGRLTMTPNDRVLVAIGDLQDRTKMTDPKAVNGKILTLDPDRDADQTPNVISRNWNDPGGVAYGPGRVLWVADIGEGEDDRLARAGDDGPAPGSITSLGRDRHPTALTDYGDQELVVCLREPKELQRFLVNDARAVPGRVLAEDCTRSTTQLADGRLAYASDTEIRVTVQ